ncbi:MAG TPA: TIGR03088 family PEP-CTERM/XrtA system glycosyltransferase [Rhodanobacteraceae bacterium]|nr:TIGR03088 family PEP-CTERM/XrtA system glycosyltransferase [Rhodanobacteraceae bacterium]
MKRRPLIVHVLYRLDTGGMERIVVSLINRTGERYRHAVVSLTGFGAMREQISDATVPCVALHKKPGKDWLFYVRLWRALRRLKPDMVQTYNLGTLDLGPVVRLAGVRRLVHAEHGRDAADPAGDNVRYQRLRRWMAPFVDRHVAVSPDLQRWLIDVVGMRAARVDYIANGVDLDAFRAASPRSGARPILGDFAPPGTLLVGNVARLDKVKDHAGLLRAFQRLHAMDGNDTCRLVIVGDGPERAALERQVATLGLTPVVRLLGNRDDVAGLLAECDVFVLSSIAEGMPVTLLEAMAARLPIVATDVGGVAAVVEANVTGTLVPPRDARALADALLAYLCDAERRRRHGDAGYLRATTRFSLATMVSAYTALYDDLLEERGRDGEPCAATSRHLTRREEH